MSHPPCPKGAAPLLAGLALVLLWSFPYAEATRNANERPRLLQAASLATRGSWRIDGLGHDPGPDSARAPGGALYPNKPPGTSVVAAAGYLAAAAIAEPDAPPTLRAVTWWSRLFAGVVPTLLLALLLWRTLAPSFGARPTALAILLYTLATPAAAYAHLLYGHQLAACLLWSGLLALTRATEPAPDRATEPDPKDSRERATGYDPKDSPARSAPTPVLAGEPTRERATGPASEDTRERATEPARDLRERATEPTPEATRPPSSPAAPVPSDTRNPSPPRRERPLLAFAGGLFAGAAVLVEYTAAFAGLVFAGLVVVLLRDRRLRTALAAGAGAVIPLAALLAYHAAVFGGPLRTGYHHSATASFAAKHNEGLLGLVAPNWPAVHAQLLSLASGLVGWAPLFPFALYALWTLSRRTGPSEHVLIARSELAAFLIVLLACVSLNFEGGWRVGPRYLVAVLPALALGWTALAARAFTTPPRTLPALLLVFLASLLATWSLVVNGLAANLWPHFDLTAIGHPVPDVLLPLLRTGHAPYTLPGLLGLPDSILLPLVLPLLAFLALATPRTLGPRPRIAVALGFCGALALVAATPRLLPSHPRAPANLRYIEKVWEPAPSGPPASAPLPARPRA